MAGRDIEGELVKLEASTEKGLLLTTDVLLKVLSFCTGELHSRAEEALKGQKKLARLMDKKPVLKT